MNATPLTHSLLAAILIAVVLVVMLREPTPMKPLDLSQSQVQSATIQTPQASGQSVDKVLLSGLDDKLSRTNDSRLQAEVLALVARVESLEAQLAQRSKPTSKFRSEPLPEVTTAPSLQKLQEQTQRMDAQWASQSADDNWEAQVDSQLQSLTEESLGLGFGEVSLAAADCRGELCKLNVTTTIEPAMMQHLLVSYVGNTHLVADTAAGQGAYVAYVTQAP